MAYPKHIEGYVEKMKLKDNGFFDITENGYHFFYTIKCKCGSGLFHVLLNDDPTIKAQCCACSDLILIYDLIYYPTASMCGRSDEFKMVEVNNNKIFEICVLYEYSDEFEVNDEEFDQDCLSWCQVFIKNKNNNSIIRILNDETA